MQRQCNAESTDSFVVTVNYIESATSNGAMTLSILGFFSDKSRKKLKNLFAFVTLQREKKRHHTRGQRLRRNSDYKLVLRERTVL